MNKLLTLCIALFLIAQSCNSDKIAGHYYNENTKGRECLYLMKNGKMEHYYKAKNNEILDTGSWRFTGESVLVTNMRWFNVVYPPDTVLGNAYFTLSRTGTLSMGDDAWSFWKTNWCKIDHAKVRKRLLKHKQP